MANSEMDYIHGYMADQTYDPTSMNAQSGIAVAEGITNAINAHIIYKSLEANQSYTFTIGNGRVALICLNHPYGSGSGAVGMYMITGGYTTAANIGVIKSDTHITITKPTINTVTISSTISAFMTIIVPN